MKPDAYLYHVTLQTGDSRKRYRSEVDDDIIALCRKLIAKMRDGERVEIPRMTGYFVSARLGGKCATFSVYAGTELLVAFGVAENERCGAQLWRGLHNSEGLPTKTDPERQPGAPWIGVALTDALHQHPDAWGWLGDFERCMAWAWIDGPTE
jgi:hypothetical protein